MLLSLVLPTVMLPLVYLTSSQGVMTVEGPECDETEGAANATRDDSIAVDTAPAAAPRRVKGYKSPLWITILGHFLTGVVVMANGYVIVELMLGN